jgi:hypothetical protein
LLCDCRDAEGSGCAHQSKNEATAKCKIQHTITMRPTCVRCLSRNLAVSSGFCKVCPLASKSYPAKVHFLVPVPQTAPTCPTSQCRKKGAQQSAFFFRKFVLMSYL